MSIIEYCAWGAAGGLLYELLAFLTAKSISKAWPWQVQDVQITMYIAGILVRITAGAILGGPAAVAFCSSSGRVSYAPIVAVVMGLIAPSLVGFIVRQFIPGIGHRIWQQVVNDMTSRSPQESSGLSAQAETTEEVLSPPTAGEPLPPATTGARHG